MIQYLKERNLYVNEPVEALEYQLHEMPWDEVLHEAVAQGYLSHQAGTCGLHVHVSRKTFGDTYDAQDRAIARVLFFVECHWRERLPLFLREQRQKDEGGGSDRFC
mgnify:CR=1 FL=1